MTAATQVFVADPSPVTDRHGRKWVWKAALYSYENDDGLAFMLRSPAQVEELCSELASDPAPPRHADTVAVPGEVHSRDEETQVMPAVGEQERRAS